MSLVRASAELCTRWQDTISPSKIVIISSPLISTGGAWRDVLCQDFTSFPSSMFLFLNDGVVQKKYSRLSTQFNSEESISFFQRITSIYFRSKFKRISQHPFCICLSLKVVLNNGCATSCLQSNRVGWRWLRATLSRASSSVYKNRCIHSLHTVLKEIYIYFFFLFL